MSDPDAVGLMDLQPGDIGFGPIDGAVGLFVGFGQAILGDDSRFRHVFVVTKAGQLGPNGLPAEAPEVVEAMPSGARVASAADRWSDRYVYVRLEAYPQEVRDQVAYHALQMAGTPYGFSDYLALALKRLGIRLRLLDNWISRVDPYGYPVRAICSQLADAACTRAGIKVFRDGRLSQDVIPGALFYQLLRIGGKALWPS
ncbi:hypothetical protein [Micromonospora maritima]|uniref:hypothetical protein n=1 Tax=Micromonospora maritima TaxID=986711 RepID=UPI001FE452F9|nr:hypothetical protein [Micromonospora maritima]